MNAERERLVLDRFEELAGAEPDRREAALKELAARDADLAARVADLLRRHLAGSGFLAEPWAEAEREQEESAYQQIGPYRITGRLGRGGTSTVFVGEREDGEWVALKVLRYGLDSARQRQRFALEAEVLRSLGHPGIAALRDAGTTPEGQPWLATELVAGVPLTDYCDHHQLPVRARLQLFLAVCEGVHHAHVRHIVHRDLKPANVLVDAAGQPRLLDFGLARLVADEAGEPTETRERILTPNYASPEHLAGRAVSTVSDVYSLGVVLCELLCGSRPWDWSGMGTSEILRALEDLAPPRPSRLAAGPDALAVARLRGTSPDGLRRQLRGDLDAIVERALRLAPEQRYASVQELAADLRRHLAGEPVLAQPSSTAYRLGKFLRRHAAATAAAGAALVALVVFATLTYRQLVTVRRERAATEAARLEAETARAQADRVTRLLLDSFAVADSPRAEGGRIAAREIPDRMVRGITELAPDPELQAAVQHAAGVAYQKLGLYEDSLRLLEEALATRRRRRGETDAATLETLLASGLVLAEAGRLEEAEQRTRAVLAARRPALGDDHAATADAAAAVATVLFGLGKLDEGLELALLAERGHSGSGDQQARVGDLNLAGAIHDREGRYELAQTAFRQAIAILRDVEGGESRELPVLLHNLAASYLRQGHPDEAVTLFAEAAGALERRLGPSHPDVAAVLDNWGAALRQLGRYGEAGEQIERALAIRRAAFGELHPSVASSLNKLGGIASRQGRAERAEELYRAALAIRRQTLPAEHPDIAESLNNLAIAAQQRGGWEEAEALLREALAIARQRFGPEHAEVGRYLHNLALVSWTRGKREEAEHGYREALAVRRAALGAAHPDTAQTLTSLAQLARDGGDLAGAEELAREALAVRVEALGSDHVDTADSRLQLAAALLGRGAAAEAGKEAAGALAAYRAALPETHWRAGMALLVHGLATAAAGDASGDAVAERGLRTVRAASPAGSIRLADAERLYAAARRSPRGG